MFLVKPWRAHLETPPTINRAGYSSFVSGSVSITLLLAPEQGLFRVLRGQGHDEIFQLHLALASAHEAKVQIVRSVVTDGIEAQDGVEELCGERKRPGIRMDRKNTVLDAGIADS